MSWTYITDDPATLPPLDTPVFILFKDNDAWIGELAYADSEDVGWAVCEDVKIQDDGWYCTFRQHIDFPNFPPIAWHPLPELPTTTNTEINK